jgi:hypothetical protein
LPTSELRSPFPEFRPQTGINLYGSWVQCAFTFSVAWKHELFVDYRTCDWTGTETVVDLTSTQTVQSVQFRIANGTLLIFNVRDPNARITDLSDLPVVDGRIPLVGANFGIGLFAGNTYARATLVSSNPGVRQYQIAVPKDASLRLFLDTALKVTDVSGAARQDRTPDLPIAAHGEATLPIELTIQ